MRKAIEIILLILIALPAIVIGFLWPFITGGFHVGLTLWDEAFGKNHKGDMK